MKKNWRKATIGTTVALVGVFLSFGSSSAIHAASTESCPTRGHETSKHAKTQRKSTAITLTVHVLPTSDGINGEGMYADKYPKRMSIRNAEAFADQIAAFGAAYHVWIGPKGWTGSAVVGVDGGTSVGLYPVGGSALSGPHIEFAETPACMACMLDGAAPYFPRAKQEYNETFDAPLPPAPPGLRVYPLSPTLVTYLLPDVGSLMVRGVVYFGEGPNRFLEDAKFVLPHADAKLLHFLMQTFVRREKLK